MKAVSNLKMVMLVVWLWSCSPAGVVDMPASGENLESLESLDALESSNSFWDWLVNYLMEKGISPGECLPVPGQGERMYPAQQGCAMAHCDNRMSDNVNLDPPEGRPVKFAHDKSVAGAFGGEGCSSNGHVAACLLAPPDNSDALVVYKADGRKLGSSGTHLNVWSWTSAAIVGTDDTVVAADNTHLARFRPNPASGQLDIVWKVCHQGGLVISPVLTDEGLIVMGTKGGPMSVFDSADGTLLAQLTIRDDSGTYDTLNTVSVNGQRYYLLTEARTDNSRGRLYAVDLVKADAGNPLLYHLVPAWYMEMHGPSYASPLRIEDRVYFDGVDADGHGVAYGIRDLGQDFEFLWRFKLEAAAPVGCSLSQDPRGGVWVMFNTWPDIYRLDEGNGRILDTLEIDKVVTQARGKTYIPASQVTIAGDDRSPVMLLSAVGAEEDVEMPSETFQPFFSNPTYTIAVDLNDNSLLWSVKLGRNVFSGPFTMGIHPIMRQGDRSVIPAAGIHSGVYFIR